MMIDRVFAPGESLEAVVVTEMPEEEAAQITSVELSVQRGDNSATVSVTQ